MDIGGCLATFGIGHCAYGVHYGHLASDSLIGTIFFPPYYKKMSALSVGECTL